MSERVAPRVQRRTLNPWVATVYDAWLSATHVWEAQAEAASLGYDTELAEYERAHPRPRYKDFLVHLARGKEVA